MSALGHELPRRALIAASALPPKAAAKVAAPRVRFGPGADMLPHSISSSAARCPHWVVNGRAGHWLGRQLSATRHRPGI